MISKVSPQLNNIIKLSDDSYTYNHISINSKGDMVIDSSALNNKERKFYGLKKDGRPFFGNSPYGSLPVEVGNNYGRSEGEALFIKFTRHYNYSNIEECIAYIPQKNNKYVEYYIFDENTAYPVQTTTNNFQNIESCRFAAVKVQSDEETNLDYIFGYVYSGKLYIYQGDFDYHNGNAFAYKDSMDIEKAKAKMISCYCTQNKIYICFYLKGKKYKYTAFTIPLSGNNEKHDTIYSISDDDNDDDDDDNDDSFSNIFLKAIHVKEEIGAFIYFKDINTKYPTITFRKSNSKLSLSLCIGTYNLNRYTYTNDELLNDLIKINEDQLCYITTNSAQEILYIVILTLYDSYSSVHTNYYLIEMKTNYNKRFYSQIISNAYNNFVVVAFSHSVVSDVSSSFFILSYPNSSDHTYDIIREIKTQQRPIDKLCFYLNETLVIENNLFEYEFYGTKIISFSDAIELKENNNIIQKDSDFILLKDNCITISFPKEDDIYKDNSYNIEIAYVVKETANADLTGYTQKILTGKYSNYSFIINNDIYCLDDNCVICNES